MARRVVGYVAVPSVELSRQEQPGSIGQAEELELQRGGIRDYAREKGWRLMDIFEGVLEPGEPSRASIRVSKGLRSAMDEIEAGRASVLVLDRLERIRSTPTTSSAWCAGTSTTRPRSLPSTTASTPREQEEWRSSTRSCGASTGSAGGPARASVRVGRGGSKLPSGRADRFRSTPVGSQTGPNCSSTSTSSATKGCRCPRSPSGSTMRASPRPAAVATGGPPPSRRPFVIRARVEAIPRHPNGIRAGRALQLSTPWQPHPVSYDQVELAAGSDSGTGPPVFERRFPDLLESNWKASWTAPLIKSPQLDERC